MGAEILAALEIISAAAATIERVQAVIRTAQQAGAWTPEMQAEVDAAKIAQQQRWASLAPKV